jgi:hypothetical protein
MCTARVADVEFLETSVVTKSAQKYSVAFLTDENGDCVDHYDYSLVRHVLAQVSTPFDGWTLTVSRRRYPVARFPDHAEGDPCPCSSGIPFERCCLPRGEVELDHYDIVFAFPVERVDDRLLGTTRPSDG